MIFADASALVAILAGETEAQDLLARLYTEAGEVYVSSLVRYEAVSAVARFLAGRDRGRPVGPSDLAEAEALYDALLQEVEAQEIALDAEIGRRALEAARTYGKLVRHPAQLNMGDCFAHACAKVLGAGLLYKGQDFARTDLA